MPTYDYQCEECGHAFAEFHPMSQDPLKKCPECEKDTLRRLIGAGAGIIFKGSGFYETDYRSESYKKAEAADAPGKSKESSDSSSKSESKSESKSGDSTSSGETKPKKTPKDD